MLATRIAVPICALVLAGCGLESAPRDGGPKPAGGPAPQTAHERPSPPAPPETVSAAAPTQVSAVRSFVTAYINWDADHVTQQMRTLASESLGQARSAMQLAAAQTAGDYELRQGGIANSGTVEAVAPLAGTRARYVVVTRETTTASNTSAYQGLRPAWHVALATVAELSPGHWAVSSWQPEN